MYLALLLYYLTCSFYYVEILEPPKSINVSINGTAIFTCKAVGLITFEVDSRAIDETLRSQGFDDSSPEVPDEDNPSINTRTLIVDGRVKNNGSKISCSVFSTSPPSSARSGAALLLVFEPSMLHCYNNFLHIILSSVFVLGLLGPPSNITSTHVNSTTIFISWNPPPTLSGSSITGYNVTITNTNSGESVTFYVMESSLLYQINHPDNFTVTVVAINAAGFGEPVTSSEFTSPFSSGKCTNFNENSVNMKF